MIPAGLSCLRALDADAGRHCGPAGRRGRWRDGLPVRVRAR